MFLTAAALANGAIEEIPRLLAEAETALPIFNLPREIEAFFNHCKKLMREMKSMIVRVREYVFFLFSFNQCRRLVNDWVVSVSC